MTFLRSLFDLGVTDDLSGTDAKHVRMINFCALLLGASSLAWLTVGLFSAQTSALVHPIAQSALLVPVLVLNARGHHTAAMVAFQVCVLTSVALGTWIWGAEARTTVGTLIMVPLPYLLLPRRERRLANFLALLAVTEGVVLEYFAESLVAQQLVTSPQVTRAFNMLFGGGLLWLVAGLFAAEVYASEAALEDERERSDRLLLNVLPPSIAARLKDSPDEVIADRHPAVSILFADIVGFTPLSATISPTESVELLNKIFTKFDRICGEHDVEKVRTIGDGYMVVAGAPEARDDHAQVLTRVALNMQRVMAEQDTLEARIGINSGAVVAAIVGTSRFHYDVWGDAVNVAARMESLGEPGRIQIARGTWEHVQNDFACTSRGVIPVKGKGEMETWFVEGEGVAG